MFSCDIAAEVSNGDGVRATVEGKGSGCPRTPKPDFRPATCTVLNFEVPDIEATVADLNSRGIEMERYDGFDQDEKGIVRIPDFPPGAWFTDSAGNIIAVLEPMG
jgi:hypothetical protein